MKIKLTNIYSLSSEYIKHASYIKGILLSGDVKKLKENQEYYLESAVYGSAAQNRFFHLLITEYFNSGCYSDNVSNLDQLKISIKIRLGQGLVEVERFRILKSWSDYTKKQRRECIDSLVNEMVTAGVNSNRFQSILNDFEWGK